MRPILDRPNTARYARARMLATEYRLFLVTRQDAHVPKELRDNIHAVLVPPFGRLYPALLDQLMHYSWVLWILLWLAARYGVRLFYTTWHAWCLVVFVARCLARARMVIDVWDDPALGLRLTQQGGKSTLHERLGLPVYLRLVRHVLQRVDAVICALEPTSLKDYAIPSDRLVHVTNGVDLAYVYRHAMPQSRLPVVFYVGATTLERGGQLLLDAWQLVIREVPEARLRVAGDMSAQEQAMFRQRVDDLGLTLYVDILGETPSEQVLRHIYTATICVFPFPPLPELLGIYPIKVLEYLAAGRAIVATDLPGVRRLTRDGQDALLVPAEADKIARAIITLLRCQDTRMKLEEQAYTRAAEFDWDAVQWPIVQRLQALYRTIYPSTVYSAEGQGEIVQRAHLSQSLPDRVVDKT
jgi:glycosyltransferase involved in cell wall biosynthesis